MSKGFFSWLFGGSDPDEDDTRTFSAQEIEQHPHGFTTERAAEIIKDLPPEVSQESAGHIVRGTLTAAGIKVEDLERSTRARDTRLKSEIELARSRQDDLERKTEEVVVSLQEDIRKAREARDNGVAEEEEKISHANAGLKDIERVRGFFGFPGGAEETTGHDEASGQAGDDTQALERFDADETQVMKRAGPLADEETSER